MSSANNPFSLVEHNLLIAQIGLEMGILTERVVKNAFTLWVCDRTERLEDLLVTMKAIRPEQKAQMMETLAEWQAKQFQSDLPSHSVSYVRSLESILEFLEDSDINHSITNLQTQVMSSSGPSGPLPTDFPPTEPAPDSSNTDRFVRKQLLNSQGGMGEIWIATDKELNREVIVKYIKEDRTRNNQHRGMFQLEGEVTGFLEHPNIPPVYGLNNDSKSRPYYAMRYYQGKKFTKAIAEYHVLGKSSAGARREAFRDLLQSFISACLAVEYAHTRGIIHCDIKPDNIILGDFGETIVLDWGLVVVTEPTGNSRIDSMSESGVARPAFSPSKVAEEGLHQRQGGSRNYVGGTLAYMAPEQLIATETGEVDKVTKASDIYCLGSTLYHLCTARAPLVPIRKKDENKVAYLERVKNARFPRPRSLRPELSPRLEAVIYKAMALNPADRYVSAQALAEEIKHWLADEPVTAYPEGASLKLGRWVRRNREKVSLGFAIFFLCLVAGASLIWRERQKTYQNYLKAKEIGVSLMSLMKDFDGVYANLEGKSAKRKKVFIATSKAFSSYVAEFPDDIGLLETYADVTRFLANIEAFDNEHDLSLEHYAAALKVLEKLQLMDPNRASEFQISVCALVRQMGGCLHFINRNDEAKKGLEDALLIANNLVEKDPDNIQCRREKALLLYVYSVVLKGVKLYHEQEKSAMEAFEILSQIINGKDKADAFTFDYLYAAQSLTQAAIAQRHLKRLKDAEKTHEEALNYVRPMTDNLKRSRLLTYMGSSQADILQRVTICLGERLLTWIELDRPSQQINDQFKMLIKQWDHLIEYNDLVPDYREQLAFILLQFGIWKINKNEEGAKQPLERSALLLTQLVSQFPDVSFYREELLEVNDFIIEASKSVPKK